MEDILEQNLKINNMQTLIKYQSAPLSKAVASYRPTQSFNARLMCQLSCFELIRGHLQRVVRLRKSDQGLGAQRLWQNVMSFRFPTNIKMAEKNYVYAKNLAPVSSEQKTKKNEHIG